MISIDNDQTDALEGGLFQAFMDNTPAVGFLKRDDGRYVYVNRTLQEVYELSAEQVLGRTDAELLPLEIARTLREHDLEVLNSGEVRRALEEIPDSEGRLRQWMVVKFPFKDRFGSRYVGGLALEATEQFQIQRCLRESEERFQKLIETSALAIAVLSGEGKISYANSSFLQVFRHGAESVLGKTWLDFIAPNQRGRVESRIEERARGEEVNGSYDTIGFRGDGTEFPFHVQESSLTLREGRSTVAFITDLTERVALEEQVRHSQKMESIGRLAGGIAHDLNNILSIISGNVQLLKLGKGISCDPADLIEEIEEATKRAAGLTRQLLTFSRKQPAVFTRVDLNEAVLSASRLMMRLLGEEILLEHRLSATSLWVNADKGMIDQIMMNLLLNARDGMNGVGTIRIDTRLEERGDEQRAIVSISDTGVGIPPENLPRIFEPFFTTKPVGEGTGLGLATVYGIVQQHEGTIQVESAPGEGATFTIDLPICPEKGTEPKGYLNSRSAKGTVLIAEDEASLRKLCSRLLENAGYKVLLAEDGLEAVRIWSEKKESIHLLLTDMIMPGGITGAELYQRVSEDKPKLPVIFMSGYSAEAGGQIPQLSHAMFLSKPFDFSHLIASVESLMQKFKC